MMEGFDYVLDVGVFVYGGQFDDPHSVEVILWQPLFGYIMNFSGSLSLNVLG